MFLKRIELLGFKSFADRVGIDFVPGVTAVVGPNGSGKSNVIDAIRWVLGEQSARSLRGAKMEDVIFSGSAGRKPLGMAEVTLLLDNEDEKLPLAYQEVSVTRRVFRSGESGYFLNRQPCRLKDITDLFMDSGLGKEAFSIISQGRVDEVLNSKPEDRRAIFEEAAGVLKYKQRKKKAEGKLAETEANLSRATDILYELEQRVPPLKSQAEKAEAFFRMEARSRKLRAGLLAFDVQEANRALAVDRAEQARQSEALTALAERQRQFTGEQVRLQAEVSRTGVALDRVQADLLAAASDAERLEGRRLLAEEKRGNTEERLASLRAQRGEQVRLLERSEKLIGDLREEKRVKEGEVRRQRGRQRDLEALARGTEEGDEREIEQLKSAYIDLLSREAALNNERQHIELQLARAAESGARAKQQLSDARERTEALRKTTAQTARDADRFLRAFTACEAAERSARERQRQRMESAERLAEEVKQSEWALSNMSARRDSLRELESQLSGYYEGVRAVLGAAERGSLSGVYGAAAQLLRVPPRAARAIDTALGASAQTLITKSSAAAEAAIAWLKRSGKGRATFFPLDRMRPRSLPESAVRAAENAPGYVGIANHLVEVDEPYRAMRDHLLGATFVAQDLRAANAIASATGFQYRTVSLEGDIVNAGGSMTGGSVKNQPSFFSRKSELDGLESEVAACERKAAAAASAYAEAQRSVREEEAQLQKAAEQARALEADWAAARAAHADAERESERLRLTVEELAALASDRTAEAEEETARQAALVQQLENVREEAKRADHRIALLERARRQGSDERAARGREAAEVETAIAVQKEQLQQIDRRLAEQAQLAEAARAKCASLREEIAHLEGGAQMETASELADALQRALAQKEERAAEAERLKKARLQSEGALREAERKLRESAAQTSAVQGELRAIEVRIARSETLRTNCLEELAEDFEIGEEGAAAIQELGVPLEEARAEAKALKAAIEALGPVNAGAIEECAEVSERCAFLQQQRDDLQEAQSMLRDAIGEMDGEMAARFLQTFRAVREQFQVVFTELFGGGRADLTLTDPASPLTTGIELIAQPPGKKLQNLLLLSGGERALTAIALLFAILKIRPVPFCILDEVEAALDDSNVARYSEYLKRYSGGTQFIVITHRKGTMEGADVLYGVTMQESGVSKLVSVRLDDERGEKPKGAKRDELFSETQTKADRHSRVGIANGEV